MDFLYVPGDCADGHGFARADAAGCNQWPGFAAGLLFSAFVPPNDGIAQFLSYRLFYVRLPGTAAGVLDGLIGAAFGSLLLLGLAKGYKAVRGREGMGMGDVKMMAMVGTFLGVRGTFLTLLLGV